MDEIVKFIIKKVQSESIFNGFQYMVPVEDIENQFNTTLSNKLQKDILHLLELREEVAEVILNNSEYDIVLYTAHAPNYRDHSCN